MITKEQAARLRNVIEEAARAGHGAVLLWGTESQEVMAVEEMGELLTAIARCNRGRIGKAAVVEEAADVIICALQVGLMFGAGDDWNPDDLIEAIANKSARLSDRVQAAKEGGAS